MIPNQRLTIDVAGFIGFQLCKKLLDQGRTIISLDNLNGCHDPNLKQALLDRLS